MSGGRGAEETRQEEKGRRGDEKEMKSSMREERKQGKDGH